jgi:hypothetical protein
LHRLIGPAEMFGVSGIFSELSAKWVGLAPMLAKPAHGA